MAPPSRRALLASLGAAATAGCLDADRTEPATTEPGETTDEPSTDSEPTSPTPEPPDSVDSTWRMPGCDPGFSNATDAAGPAAPVGELWRFVGDAGLSAPVVAYGAVYAGTVDGDVVALDAGSGEERWRRSVGETAFTPRVVSGTLYVPTDRGIVALRANGAEQWRLETAGRDDSTGGASSRATVLATGDSLYWIQATDGAPTVVANSLEDGSERWRTEIEEPWTRRLFAGPETVFVPSGTNGQRAWRLSAADGERLTHPEPGYDFPAERLYRDDTVYATEPLFGGVSAASLGDDGRSWDTGVPSGTHHVSAGPDRLYVGVDGGDESGLYALSASDGSEAWSAPVTPTGRPVVAAASVLVHGPESLYCLDPADGSERWSRSNDDVGAEMAVADDLLFAVGGETLRAFRPQ